MIGNYFRKIKIIIIINQIIINVVLNIDLK